MSVHIECDRCGRMDDHHWRNLKISLQHGSYASLSAPGYYSTPWNIERHVCGYCAAALRDWWNQDQPVVQNQDREPPA